MEPNPPTDWVHNYQRLDLDEVVALAEQEGRPYRIIRPGDAITLDFHSGRLNVYLDDAGAIERLTSG